MKHKAALILFVSVVPLAGTAQDAAPLSAIDWLSESVVEPPTSQNQRPRPPVDEPPVTGDASTPQITVTPLDAPSNDPVGLLASDVTGLPKSLWSSSDVDTVIALTQAQAQPSLPAMREMLVTLLLAEADPPRGARPEASLFLARVDALLALGALPQAQSLLEAAGTDDAETFRRYFDVALLTGTENDACAMMDNGAGVAPTYPARIFCLARSGDWRTAALTLNTHRVLGDVTPAEEALLTRFLDADLFEGEAPLPPPDRTTPLQFRLREAIGEPMPTRELPLPFAHADLRNITGWKAQLDAAERLSRAGAISGSELLGFYTAREPSASGGVWDRVADIQRFDAAVSADDAEAVARHLPAAWDAMTSIRAEVPFASVYGDMLADLSLTGDAKELAVTIGLLSSQYEAVAQANPTADPFLAGVARGFPDPVAAQTDRESTVLAAFVPADPPEALTALADEGKLGEALLRAISDFNAGYAGDPEAVTGALSFFRSVGLEDTARRAALQYLLLERRT